MAGVAVAVVGHRSGRMLVATTVSFDLANMLVALGDVERRLALAVDAVRNIAAAGLPAGHGEVRRACRDQHDSFAAVECSCKCSRFDPEELG